jgi:hypothetical protein
MAEIERLAGQSFDPDLVAAFRVLYDKGIIEGIRKRYSNSA